MHLKKTTTIQWAWRFELSLCWVDLVQRWARFNSDLTSSWIYRNGLQAVDSPQAFHALYGGNTTRLLPQDWVLNLDKNYKH